MHSYKGFFLFCGIALLACLTLQSCDDEDSYGKRKSKERKTINSFIKKGTLIMAADAADTLVYVPPIKVISEKQFEEQDSTTDVSKNEYVYFPQTGIYMQIVREGVGEKLKSGENATILCRYTEVNVRGDSIQTSNQNIYYTAVPDKMTIRLGRDVLHLRLRLYHGIRAVGLAVPPDIHQDRPAGQRRRQDSQGAPHPARCPGPAGCEQECVRLLLRHNISERL